ncbi:MAG TPA: SET domain-containing protein-lysine N-methyltransferase [Thiotrichaceae bacterium]|nr:SET domain-containing protein-lysine N-methyltransferase [Thiotrichaceae bacterium]
MTKKYKVIPHENMGRIVVATDHYAYNELICVGRRTGVAQIRNNYSLQISEQEHAYLDEPAQVFSHSCAPNVYIVDNDFGGYNFYAARDIEPEEILAFHYGMSEAESIAVSVCCCGAKNCLGKSVGFKEAPFHVQTYLYNLGVSSYLRKCYEDIKDKTKH